MKGLIALITVMLMTVSDAPERFEWRENTPLQWSDFKGNPDTKYAWAASSSTGISQGYTMSHDGYLQRSSVTITAYFYPEYSWVRQQQKSRHLLGHEQTHFDITELYARKLKKQINDFTFTSNSLEEIKSLYNKIEKERIATQQAFDRESNHSINHMEEIKWELKVERMLNGLQEIDFSK